MNKKKYIDKQKEGLTGWRLDMNIIIYEADTYWGKFFDVGLLVAIALSVLAVMMESVASFNAKYGEFLRITEWIFTGLFSLEYLARLICVRRPLKYAISPLGIIDVLSIIPTFLSFFVAGTQMLLVIRTLRLLRVFRIFKLARYTGEATQLLDALKASQYKISVFLGSVLSLVVILGTVMYLIEGPENGFNSIPHSIYWAIVTLTTVGYGDIAPHTVTGQALASFIMIIGYAIIAVPTGIVTSEITAAKIKNKLICHGCGKEDHQPNASFCSNCGEKLSLREEPQL